MLPVRRRTRLRQPRWAMHYPARPAVRAFDALSEAIQARAENVRPSLARACRCFGSLVTIAFLAGSTEHSEHQSSRRLRRAVGGRPTTWIITPADQKESVCHCTQTGAAPDTMSLMIFPISMN